MELIKVYDGFIIKVGNKYIMSRHNGIYKYTLDYTYAKHYTKRTANKIRKGARL